MKLNCQICGKGYIHSPARSANSKYCSNECFRVAKYTGRFVKCLECNKDFYIPKNRLGANYCSVDCYNKNRKRITGAEHGNWKGGNKSLVCRVCGREYLIPRKRIAKSKYCSPECRSVDLKTRYKGAGSPAWRGGKTPSNILIRNSTDYAKWRDDVFTRDKWICQDCGQVGGKLHVHHVFNFSEFPEHRLEVWNGATLCENCHSLLHGRTINSFGNGKH